MHASRGNGGDGEEAPPKADQAAIGQVEVPQRCGVRAKNVTKGHQPRSSGSREGDTEPLRTSTSRKAGKLQDGWVQGHHPCHRVVIGMELL